MEDQLDSDAVIVLARAEKDKYGLSDKEYQAYRAHYHSAKRRGIAFRFSMLGWHLWWLRALKAIGPHAQRGRRRDEYVMARKKDRGAYEDGNVRALIPRENMRDRHPESVAEARRRIAATHKARGTQHGQHLKVRGDGHPKSMAVMTPLGRFGSIALAAEEYGITRAGASKRVKREHPGWALCD